MSYEIRYSPFAELQIERLKKSGDKTVLKKIQTLLEEIREYPYSDTGHVEELKYYKGQNIWSRRITKKDRLVYEVLDDKIIVIVLSVLGHYTDK